MTWKLKPIYFSPMATQVISHSTYVTAYARVAAFMRYVAELTVLSY